MRTAAISLKEFQFANMCRLGFWMKTDWLEGIQEKIYPAHKVIELAINCSTFIHQIRQYFQLKET
jgi:hypothetical protein